MSTLLTGTALALAAMGAAPALAGGVTAGTLIENTAVASYEEAGVTRSVQSNTVAVRVDELLDVTLTSLDSGPVTARPGNAVLAFELTNQGNGPEAFRLIATTAVGGNDFDVALRALAVDSNANGIYDEGIDEILAAPQTTAELAADAALTVFVLVTVPDGVTDSQISNVDLVAEATTGSGTPGTTFSGAGADGGDAIVGNTGALATARGSLRNTRASVELIKSVSLRDPFGGTGAVPGSIATFTIEARVSGTGSVANLLVRDAIPAGTTYAPGTLALDTTPLTDAADGDAGSASQSDGIAVTLGNVPAGTRRTITFNVTVNP
ncbi:hypothetical protein [Erythrobacter tepidarius]|uniref:hypothetical protein n=1 Tax=Erythrobacter tepidarius TaxID=60454 RepID=UPI001FECDE3A|nr:hypothetical protein [Erythrobacter tepidarius]